MLYRYNSFLKVTKSGAIGLLAVREDFNYGTVSLRRRTIHSASADIDQSSVLQCIRMDQKLPAFFVRTGSGARSWMVIKCQEFFLKRNNFQIKHINN